MTELVIVSGFLGAGKTTLIRQLAQRCLSDARLVVLENDFGEAAVDTAMLRQARLTVADLSAGCICCSLRTDFVKKLRQIREELEPDIILVEPSGISKVSEVIQGCLRAETKGGFRLGRVITVADVRSFRKYLENYGAFFEDQLAYADVILLSHQEDAANQVPEVIHELQKINPEVEIVAKPWDLLAGHTLFSAARNSRTAKLMLQAELERKPERLRMRGRQRPAGISLNPLGHLFGEKRFCTVSFLWKDALCEDELRRKIRAVLSVYGNRILRAKGIVAASDAAGGLLFQYSGEALRIERIGAAGEMLCFIGLDLNGEVLETSFRKG